MLDHFAVHADDLAKTAAFYDAVLAPLGGHRMDGYFGAFVRDPDDNNVEAVCHQPQ